MDPMGIYLLNLKFKNFSDSLKKCIEYFGYGPSHSDHQNHHMFSRGSQVKSSFTTIAYMSHEKRNGRTFHEMLVV